LKEKIEELIRKKGIGYITTDNGREVFFHSSALEGMGFGTLRDPDAAEFNMEGKLQRQSVEPEGRSKEAKREGIDKIKTFSIVTANT
jgi:cold shock CspA family protein